MNQDKTVELVTNLDRAAVHALLAQISAEASAKDLEDLVTLLGDYASMNRAELGKRVSLCLEYLSASPEHQAIFSKLELVELNLPNLA